MAHIPREELLKQINSVYKLVIIASLRTFDLCEGAPKLISKKFDKASQTALEEIREGKVNYKEKAGK